MFPDRISGGLPDACVRPFLCVIFMRNPPNGSPVFEIPIVARPLPMENDFIQYVPILETHNAGDRAFLKSLLDAEGITYFIQGEYVAPYVFNALPMRLMVRKDQVEKARELLKNVTLSYSYGFKAASEDDEDPKQD
jgi:Putative prokaryotic signal transducing protein